MMSAGNARCSIATRKKRRLRIRSQPITKGYYQFFVGQAGRYQVVISGRGTEYQMNKLLVDPTGPQILFASPTQPALTLTQVTPDILCVLDPSDPCCNGAMSPPCAGAWIYNDWSTTSALFERRNSAGVLVGAPWTINGYRAEREQAWMYNSFGCQIVGVMGDPIVQGITLDNVFEDNVIDRGNLGFPSLWLDYHGAGIVGSQSGVWLAPEAGTAVNVDMAISGAAPEPGEVVVISPDVSHAVVKTSQVGGRAPFVVTALQNGRALVAISGIADVKVTGPVAVGDPLVTSAQPGFAQAAPGALAPTTLGSAMTVPDGTGRVRARIGMVQSP
jgi:hypothetical protein